MEILKKKVQLSIVSPVYNEEINVEIFYNEIQKVFLKLKDINIEVIFCLDPSEDNTESKLKSICKQDLRFKILKMSRKFGQPACTMAGIENCHGKYCVVIDFDLQDPVDLIPQLYKKIVSEKYDVVNAVRKTRKGLSFFYNVISLFGYYIINKFSDLKIPRNVGDFRIFNRKIIDKLKLLKESHNFLRGLISFVGFKQGEIFFDRENRKLGKSKYSSYFGSFKIGINGLVSYSNFPLNLIFFIGIFLLIFFVLGATSIAINILVYDKQLYSIGIPTLITISLLIGGVQILSLGVLGQYIARIYDETKNRPKYIIDEKINFNVDE
jgi:dolichol-phosphate mannosyltransferase